MRFLPIALVPLAVVGSESETALLVPSETPRSLLQLSEVPYSSFSEAPFSDFPHSEVPYASFSEAPFSDFPHSEVPYSSFSEAPFSDFPHSEVPYSSFSEAPFSDFPHSEYPFSDSPSYYDASDCIDTNDDVLNALHDAFGEENCIPEEQPSRKLDGSDDFDVRIECNMKVTGFEAWATYDYKILGDTPLPQSLQLIDAYTGGSSFAQYIMFMEECLDSLEETLFKIEQFRVERSCKNKAGSFSYNTGNGKKETSCDELSELPFKKQRKKCKKIPKIAKKCPGVCRTSEWCSCIDNPMAFPLSGSKKTLTCEKLEGKKEDRRKKKCKIKEIRGNCPSICKGFCSKPPYKASLNV